MKKNDFESISFIEYKKVENSKVVVLPNVNEIARELTSKTQIGLIIGRLLKKPINWILLGYNNIFFIPKILKKDFSIGIKLLCELEILKNPKKRYALHNQFTDMAVAFKNKGIITNFLLLAQKYNFKPELISYNIGPLVNFLSTVPNLPKNITIYTPINPDNLHMNPSYKDVIGYLKNSKLTFVKIRHE